VEVVVPVSTCRAQVGRCHLRMPWLQSFAVRIGFACAIATFYDGSSPSIVANE